ncbi:MAG: non-canonical purine NTP pyrophosphatase [bacterium]|nr:non-canonical purine NTP pyrophosphatase [bacterium]
MSEITFITGNQKKADYLAKYLGFPVKHVKLDLDEIQSLDLKKIVEHKVRQAYEKIQAPVIVEDNSLEFEGLGGLPGPFIRFFVERLTNQEMCALVNGKSRRAKIRVVYGYCDGVRTEFFEAELDGEVAITPAGNNGWDWDSIIIPKGYEVTRAMLSDEEYKKVYMQARPLEPLKRFLETLS